ncbi:hypothetical protein FOMPIDRAFT_91902 [Fomitopsis schrenkii]|uniref:Uncharacterized protein n=1 Tax=Fomitopsis schrenkii TaxID=2126942 RepID=S8EA87_FOMSC|nr:hypothetical protein FOMPIDRAFT_91902 [Fomitopsis schrenkii]
MTVDHDRSAHYPCRLVRGAAPPRVCGEDINAERRLAPSPSCTSVLFQDSDPNLALKLAGTVCAWISSSGGRQLLERLAHYGTTESPLSAYLPPSGADAESSSSLSARLRMFSAFSLTRPCMVELGFGRHGESYFDCGPPGTNRVSLCGSPSELLTLLVCTLRHVSRSPSHPLNSSTFKLEFGLPSSVSLFVYIPNCKPLFGLNLTTVPMSACPQVTLIKAVPEVTVAHASLAIQTSPALRSSLASLLSVYLVVVFYALSFISIHCHSLNDQLASGAGTCSRARRCEPSGLT